MFKSMTKSRLIMMGGTLTCALGIGVLMQMTVADTTDEDAPKLQSASVAVSPLLADPTFTPESTATNKAPNEALPETKVASELAEALIGDAPEDVAASEPTIDIASSATFEVAEGALNLEAATLTRAEPTPPAAAPQPAALSHAPLEVKVAALGDTPSIETLREETAPGFSCEMMLSARPDDAALVALDLDAPCMANERFTLHHNGMMITGVTDDAGEWQADIPALSQQALFIVAFANGEGTIANAEVAALSQYDRYVVQWKGYSGMQIHALEYGADYGQVGHVWHDTARDADMALRGEGGFLLSLGDAGMDDALRAEVYSFPTGSAQRDGDVKISLETEITQANCGRDIEAQALIKTANGTLGARDLKLAMPDCNAVGDFLVLKNLYEDLKIARN